MHPILVSTKWMTIYSFGTLVAMGYLFAGFLLWREMRQKGKDPMAFLDLGLGVLLSSLLGGRLLFILLNLREYLEDPVEIFKIYHGGLVFYGGFLSALLFAFWFIHKKNLPLWETLDVMTPYAVLVHAFGRIGCFLNGCCYGKPTSLFWGVRFPGEEVSLHPTQLYESFFLFVLFAFLRKLPKRRALAHGTLFLLYLFSYGLFRFFVEFYRGDQEFFYGGWTLPQLLSLFLLIAALVLGRRKRT